MNDYFQMKYNIAVAVAAIVIIVILLIGWTFKKLSELWVKFSNRIHDKNNYKNLDWGIILALRRELIWDLTLHK